MTTRKPTVEDAATARQILLDGVAHDAEVFEILSRLAPLHPRNNTFPGEVLLHLPWRPTLATGPESTGLIRSTWTGCASGSFPSAA